MTTQKQNTGEKEVKYENMRRLNSMMHPKGEFYEVLADIKTLKGKIDGMLNGFQPQDSQKEVVEEAVPSQKKPEKEASTVVLTPAPAVSPVKPPEEKKETIVRTRQFTPDTSKVPSYIKGVMTPPPPPPPRVIRQDRRPGVNQGDKRRPDTRRPGANGPARDGAGRPQQKPFIPKVTATVAPPINKDRSKPFEKKKDFKQGDDKKAMNKRTLIRKGFITEDLDEERMGTRKLKNRKPKEIKAFMPMRIERAVITTENLTVKILSEKIGKTAQEIIKQLMVLGIMTTINSVVDFPTMELVANELGVELELKLDKTKEEQLEAMHDEADAEKDLVKRPPIITVMGHVDHGKTSVLDVIRKTSIASGEAGGITQHIGAYSVPVKGERITFLDTPGHEAFTEMRARGAKVTDIAVLVVAADDGVMPQTVEAINHAKAANVPILVAINKIDKPAANAERIMQQLTEYGLVPEEWGGETIMVPISAKQNQGIDKLLEMILLMAEYNNYRANPGRKAKGSIIEAKLDKGKGPIANIIVQNGTLNIGDFIVSGYTYGRVRAMVDDKGRAVKEATPSMPVSVLGFTDVPSSGEPVYVVADEKAARQIVDERTAKIRNEQVNQGQKVTLDDVFNRISEGQLKDLNIIIKADVQGSVEALTTSLTKLSNEEVRVNVIHGGAGAINKSDMMLAEVSGAIIVGFGVRPDAESKALAESKGIDIRLYNIIYEVIDDVEKAMKGMLTPKYHEVVLGRAEVRNVFKITNVGLVAGSYILSGKLTRGAKVRVFRGEEIIHEGVIEGLKRFKDDVKEVSTGYECGVSVGGYSDIKEGDQIEAYSLEEIK